MRDLSPLYQLDLLGGDFRKGEEVAENLERLSTVHGAPLILKRDGGVTSIMLLSMRSSHGTW